MRKGKGSNSEHCFAFIPHLDSRLVITHTRSARRMYGYEVEEKQIIIIDGLLWKMRTDEKHNTRQGRTNENR